MILEERQYQDIDMKQFFFTLKWLKMLSDYF